MRHPSRLALPLLTVLAIAPLALAAGRASLQVYFQQTLTETAYQQQAFARIAAKWKQPSRKGLPQMGKKAVVRAVIARDGSLQSAELSHTSGAPAWDEAALRAVRDAAPFPPLPEGFAHPTVEAHLHVTWGPKGR